MNMKEAMYIYYSGYGPTSMYTLQDWFNARELVKSNYHLAVKVKKQIGLDK